MRAPLMLTLIAARLLRGSDPVQDIAPAPPLPARVPVPARFAE